MPATTVEYTSRISGIEKRPHLVEHLGAGQCKIAMPDNIVCCGVLLMRPNAPPRKEAHPDVLHLDRIGRKCDHIIAHCPNPLNIGTDTAKRIPLVDIIRRDMLKPLSYDKIEQGILLQTNTEQRRQPDNACPLFVSHDIFQLPAKRAVR